MVMEGEGRPSDYDLFLVTPSAVDGAPMSKVARLASAARLVGQTLEALNRCAVQSRGVPHHAVCCLGMRATIRGPPAGLGCQLVQTRCMSRRGVWVLAWVQQR